MPQWHRQGAGVGETEIETGTDRLGNVDYRGKNGVNIKGIDGRTLLQCMHNYMLIGYFFSNIFQYTINLS